MLRLKETSRGRADDTADFVIPTWHVGDDGARVIVFEIQDCPRGVDGVSETGIPVAKIACRTEYAADLKRLLDVFSAP